ncbi:hypothetical protein TanjilG_31276 [Lupinus angustifolius]|uniref:Uncharacterized protein n=1 Tax=Lupinus angustifolius TaxID=3871 RepID=A0A4P1RT40_LUPAN|nr:hypothetical protein TanjilG_31276 [Lupinus angustifolius]
MGNGESTYNSHDDFFQQPYSYSGSSGNIRYHESSSHAESSVNTSYQYKQLPTYIADNFSSLDHVFTVVSALRKAGLEPSYLVLGIDFTKSNEWIGKHSFNHKSLHSIRITHDRNEQAISIIGDHISSAPCHTLSSFGEDNLIPCFGYGDGSIHDKNVFSFYPDHRSCHGDHEFNS